MAKIGRRFIMASASALAVLAFSPPGSLNLAQFGLDGSAFAQGAGQGGQGGQGGSRGAGESGRGGGPGAGSGGGAGGALSGGSRGGSAKGGGQGGSGADTGGRPTWSKEGIPEVELGRLNVIRSPDRIFDRQLTELLANWNPTLASIYSMTSEQFEAYVAANWDSATIIDSPLQNLAILKAVVEDGRLNVLPGVTISSVPELAAILIGTASDKNVPISTNTIVAIYTIMGVPITQEAAAALATDADQVRLAILAAHG